MVTDYFFVCSYFFLQLDNENLNNQKFLGYGNNRKQTENILNVVTKIWLQAKTRKKTLL